MTDPAPTPAEPPAPSPATDPAPSTSEPAAIEPASTAPIATAPIATTPIAAAPIATAPIATAPIATAPIATAPIGAPIATAPIAEPAPVAPAPQLGTRIVAGVVLILSALATWFFARHTLGADLGTESRGLRLLMQLASIVVPLYPGVLAAWALLHGRRPPAQWNPFGLPFEAWWFDTLLTLTWREVKGFFGRPVAYVVLFFWMLSNAFMFMRIIEYYSNEMSTPGFAASYFIATNQILMLVLALTCPALTMRLIAEERSSGSLELLLTAPVTHAQVVLSKFGGVFSFYLSALGVLLLFMCVLRSYAAPDAWDWGPVFGALLGLSFVGGLYLSLGLFASSITDNQIVAYVLGLAPLLLLSFVSWGVVPNLEDLPALRDFLDRLDLVTRQQELGRGIVRWNTLVFFVSTTSMFLFLAVRGLASHTWR